MEGAEREPEAAGEDGPSKPAGESSTKIALVPFAEADPQVLLADSTGKSFPVRARSPERDFQLAVQSLALGKSEAAVAEVKGSPEEAAVDEPSAGGDGPGRPQEVDADGKDAKAEALPKLSDEKKPPEAGAEKDAPEPAQHPLQKAVTSFDMALGELNQLVHLIDMARAGEFMKLERVTPSEEDHARALYDKQARPGNGVPREALATMVKMKKLQLKGAADHLRQRATRLRETSRKQQAFQDGMLDVRKSWRIIAPNHGKVNLPLQVGEALSVDCSFGSAGGRAVPYNAAAGTRHRHPWLFPLTPGKDGRLELDPRRSQSSKVLEVQVVSAVDGLCQHVLRSSFSTNRGWRDKTSGVDDASSKASNGERSGGRAGLAYLPHLKRHIARLQHSVLWEEVFETLKAEAVVDGKDGWPARQDRAGSTKDPARETESATKVNREGGKRRLVRSSSRSVPDIRSSSSGARVVHVMDDEVMVEMNAQYLLRYKLVSREARYNEKESSPDRSETNDRATCSGKRRARSEPVDANLEALCHLALLYCASIIRQHQQTRARAQNALGSPTSGTTSRTPSSSATGTNGTGTKSAARSTWRSVGGVLAHHIFRSEVVRALTGVSRSLRDIGLPLVFRWTHLETTCARSAITFTMGPKLHFRAFVEDGCGIAVSALPGLHNSVDQRFVDLQSASDLQEFLLGEACRQIVLTFGDIAAAWSSGRQPCANFFRVELAPAAIYFMPSAKGTPGSPSLEESSWRGWEVRVRVQEARLRIACSKWPRPPLALKMHEGKSKAGMTSRESALQEDGSLRDVTPAEWEKLEGRDVFVKFSSLLASLYPLRD